MDSTTCDKIVIKSGNSYMVNITEQIKLLDLTVGDGVRITIEKI